MIGASDHIPFHLDAMQGRSTRCADRQMRPHVRAVSLEHYRSSAGATIEHDIFTTEARVAGYSGDADRRSNPQRSEEHTSELQSLMSISSADLCLKTTKHR